MDCTYSADLAIRLFGIIFYSSHRESILLRGALDCTVSPVWLVPTGVYLITFLIGNLSYSPCNEPSRTVLILDQMYTMYARQLS